VRWFYPLVFALCAWPGVVLAWQAAPVLLPAFWPDLVLPWEGDLGVNPVETLLHETGRDALMILIATLAITPIRRLTGWNRIQSVRRMVGVWSFVYALAHFSVYAVFDKVGDVAAITQDVVERRFIFSGMLAFVILVALAATSTRGMMRRLGRRWQRLHRLVYVAAIAGAVHFAWGQKADIGEPLLWAAVLAVLLGIRVVYALRRRRAAVVPAVSH
jgi:sulfoxide reductase heme-binding subunit YedZ